MRTFLGLAIPRLPRHDTKNLPELLKGATSSPVRDCFTFEAYVEYVYAYKSNLFWRWYFSETLDQLLVDNLFWRNTKVILSMKVNGADINFKVF